VVSKRVVLDGVLRVQFLDEVEVTLSGQFLGDAASNPLVSGLIVGWW